MPTVVFVDAGKWDGFFQLAARIRKVGCRVVRVSTAHGLHHRLVTRLVFHRFVELFDPSELADLGQLIAGERVSDVQSIESLLAPVASGLGDWASTDLRRSLQRQLVLVDKLEASNFMADCGAAVPETVVLAGDLTTQAVAARLGLPVVVKARVGASGVGVRVAETHAALEEALAEARRAPGRHFAERFIRGESLSYAAMVGPTGVEQEILTRAWHHQTSSRGPMSEHETIDDAGTIAVCRRVATATGCRGPVQIDVVRDEGGVPWLHDLNLRAWASVGCSMRAGIDFAEGYLRAIGIREDLPLLRSPAAGMRFSAFPIDLAEELSLGHYLKSLACFARACRPYSKWFGKRYVVCEAFSLVLLVHYMARELFRARRSRLW